MYKSRSGDLLTRCPGLLCNIASKHIALMYYGIEMVFGSGKNESSYLYTIEKLFILTLDAVYLLFRIKLEILF